MLNKLIKINISKVGHEGDFIHDTHIKMLKEYFKEENFEISFNDKPQKNSINFLFEGWSKKKLNDVNNFMSDTSLKYGIIYTEKLSYSTGLNKKYFSINNYSFLKLKKIRKYYLVIVHFQVIIMKFIYKLFRYLEKFNNFRFSKETSKFVRIIIKLCGIITQPLEKLFWKLSKNLYDISPNCNSYLFGWNPMFKEIFNNTFPLIPKFKYHLNLGMDDDKKFLSKKNDFYHNLPMIVEKFEDNFKDKIYDIIFFGRLTPRRKLILDRLRKKLKIKVITDFISDKLLKSYISQSKFIINLKQFDNQNFISFAKVYEGLLMRAPNIVELNENEEIVPGYLKDIIFTFSSSSLNTIYNLVDSYDNIAKIYSQKSFDYQSFSRDQKNLFLNRIKKYENKSN